MSSSSSWLLTLTLVGHASGFGVTPLVTPCACRSPRAVSAAMKVWEKRKVRAGNGAQCCSGILANDKHSFC